MQILSTIVRTFWSGTNLWLFYNNLEGNLFVGISHSFNILSNFFWFKDSVFVGNWRYLEHEIQPFHFLFLFSWYKTESIQFAFQDHYKNGRAFATLANHTACRALDISVLPIFPRLHMWIALIDWFLTPLCHSENLDCSRRVPDHR